MQKQSKKNPTAPELNVKSEFITRYVETFIADNGIESITHTLDDAILDSVSDENIARSSQSSRENKLIMLMQMRDLFSNLDISINLNKMHTETNVLSKKLDSLMAMVAIQTT